MAIIDRSQSHPRKSHSLDSSEESYSKQMQVVNMLWKDLKQWKRGNDKGIELGEYRFSYNDLLKAKYIDTGSMNFVFIVREYHSGTTKVLKYAKEGELAEDYDDIQKQLGLFRCFQEDFPQIAFHIPETQVIPAPNNAERFAIVSEYIEGRHLRMKDVYTDPEIKKQVLDLGKAFTHFVKNYRYPVSLDLMGASQGVQCALFALGFKNDFELSNIIVAKDSEGKKRLVMVDTGLALGTGKSALKLVANLGSFLGQFLTMYHMKAIASGRDESLVC